MTHETKVGLLVSGSFICLVGVVVYLKVNDPGSTQPVEAAGNSSDLPWPVAGAGKATVGTEPGSSTVPAPPAGESKATPKPLPSELQLVGGAPPAPAVPRPDTLPQAPPAAPTMPLMGGGPPPSPPAPPPDVPPRPTSADPDPFERTNAVPTEPGKAVPAVPPGAPSAGGIDNPIVPRVTDRTEPIPPAPVEPFIPGAAPPPRGSDSPTPQENVPLAPPAGSLPRPESPPPTPPESPPPAPPEPPPPSPPGNPASPLPPAPSMPGSGPAPSMPGSGPAPSMPGSSPAPSMPGSGPAPSLPGSGPAPSLPGSGPAPSLPGSGPAPSLPGSGPAPSLPGSGPAPSLPGSGLPPAVIPPPPVSLDPPPPSPPSRPGAAAPVNPEPPMVPTPRGPENPGSNINLAPPQPVNPPGNPAGPTGAAGFERPPSAVGGSVPLLAGTPSATSPPIPIQVPVGGGGNPPPAVVIRPPVVYGPDVESFDEETYICKMNDTLAAISKQKYHDEKYAPALLLFNRAHPLAADGIRNEPPILRPGEPIYIPPVEVLQRRYPAAAPGLPGAAAPTGAAPNPLAVNSRGGERTYQIQGRPETYYEIAKKVLNDSNRWGDIWRMNPAYPNPTEPLPINAVVRLPVR